MGPHVAAAPRVFAMTLQEHDYIIVGGGTAGCVLAGRLSEDPSLRICLIEAGGSDDHLALRIPALTFLANRGDRFLSRDVSEPEPTLDGRRLPWVHGRVLGGGSSVNGMIYMRGHSSEYDAWQCEGWSFREVLACYRRAESSERGASEWHGGDGPVSVARGRSPLPLCDAFLEAASACGYPVVDDLNADVAEGFGHYDHTISRGVRSSTARAYLRRRPNLTVLTRTAALRLVFEGARARGVEVIRQGVRQTLRASSEIIVCAGAVNSPHLLMLSGVGPADHLLEHGVSVVADAPDVGGNVQNHVRYALHYSCEAPVTAYQYRQPLRALAAGLRYAFNRGGFLGRTTMSTGGCFKTDPTIEVADMKVSLFNGLMGSAAGRPGMLPAEEGFMFVLHQGSPHSRGAIRLRSGDPSARPAIFPGNFTDPRDMPVLVEGVRRMRELAAQPQMQRFGIAEVQPSPAVCGAAAVAQDIRAKAMNIYHDVGSCRMGMDARSVVDAQLRVRGVEGLRIADASIIPRLMNANTNAPVIMVAEKAADLIRAN
jgi:choline dehydrogenase